MIQYAKLVPLTNHARPHHGCYTLDCSLIVKLTNEHFDQLCRASPDAKFEQNANGDLVIMTPTGGETGRCNSEITADSVIWDRQTQSGVVFDSSTCFVLPNGAKRSPNVAWVANDCWEALTLEQRKKFPPITPNSVLELLSPTDKLANAQANMREYQDTGFAHVS